MRKTALAAGAFALAIALGACSGGEEGGTANPAGDAGNAGTSLFGNTEELVAAASEKTEQSNSSKFTIEMTMGGQTIKGNGQARYDGANTAMALTMDTGGQSIEMRLVDKAMYLKLPEAARAQMGGKTWVEISPDGKDPLSKQLGSSFDQMSENSDPRKTLDYIQRAGTITNSEKTQLDGQEVTHYNIDLDFKKIAEEFGAGQVTPEQAKQLADKVGKLPMELWLNSDNLPVQVSMNLDKVMQAAGAPAGQGGAKMVMKYSDWGQPVDVQAPPADQVGKMPSMPKQPN